MFCLGATVGVWLEVLPELTVDKSVDLVALLDVGVSLFLAVFVVRMLDRRKMSADTQAQLLIRAIEKAELSLEEAGNLLKGQTFSLPDATTVCSTLSQRLASVLSATQNASLFSGRPAFLAQAVAASEAAETVYELLTKTDTDPAVPSLSLSGSNLTLQPDRLEQAIAEIATIRRILHRMYSSIYA